MNLLSKNHPKIITYGLIFIYIFKIVRKYLKEKKVEHEFILYLSR